MRGAQLPVPATNERVEVCGPDLFARVLTRKYEPSNGEDRPAKPTSHRKSCPTDMGLDIQFSATPLAPEALSPDCYPPMVADGIHDEREPAEESTMPRALGTRQFPISLLIGTPLACSPHALDVRETSLRGGCPMNRRSSWAQSQKEEAANFHVGSKGQL